MADNIFKRISNALTSIGNTDVKGTAVTNLNRSMPPAQLQRLRQDVGMWRSSISEAEQAYYPHRVKMQQMYVDTVINSHVASAMERRKDLTLLRDYEILDAQGNEIEGLEDIFDSQWFDQLVSYSLDAIFYGYSLIGLNDIDNGNFKDLSLIKRWMVSPDRLEVTRFIYSQNGAKFLEEPYKNWHIWCTTPSDNGQSQCGYGLLYKVALLEIFLRNTLAYNGDFVELYSQPYRIGTTTKTNEDERAQLERALQNMGSSGYAVIDPQDEIKFLETALGGTGWKGYENLEMRCQKAISKLILGHADALDSTAGKLGATQGEETPIYQAMEDKQTKDGKYIENMINGQLIPKMRNLGFKLPDGIVFKYSNNAETEEVKLKQVDYATKLSAVAVNLKNAGLGIDEQFFTEETGIPVYVNPTAMPSVPFSNKVKNKLENLYN